MYINRLPFMLARWWMTAEFSFLYVAIPVILIYTEDTFPVIASLLVIVLMVTFLAYCNNRRLHYPELFYFSEWIEWRNMLGLFIINGSILTALAWFFIPEYFLSFPSERPQIWFLVMMLYPVLSVLPQELIFRFYFFRRYQSFFAFSPAMWVISSAVLFAFGHILYAHWFTLTAAFLGGLIFAWRYMHTQSVPLILVEHALYGNLIFTVGFGQFFFSGAV